VNHKSATENCVRILMISAEMGIGGSFAAKAIEVLVPSWGEINVSLVAALSVLLLAGYVHQQANMPKEAAEEDHEETTTNPERKGQDILATTPPPLELENDDNDTVKASAAGSTISGELLPENKSSSFIYLIRVQTCRLDLLLQDLGV
jgi:hypothetical protein